MTIPNCLKKSFDIPLGKRIRINIFLIPMLVFAFFQGYAHIFLLTYTFALLHEFAHVLCAAALKVKISFVRFYPFGVSAQLSRGYIASGDKEFFIALCGPLASLVLFWACSFLNGLNPNALLKFAADTNLAICLINLIPALPLDGGRILKSLLTSQFGAIRAFSILIKLSRVIIGLLFAFVLGLIFINRFNFSLVLICAFLLQNLSFEEQAISTLAFREIISAKQKADFCETLRPKVLCMPEERSASSLLKHLSYDRFCLVCRMDKDFNISGILTEVQILNALTEHGLRTKYKDIQN